MSARTGPPGGGLTVPCAALAHATVPLARASGKARRRQLAAAPGAQREGAILVGREATIDPMGVELPGAPAAGESARA